MKPLTSEADPDISDMGIVNISDNDFLPILQLTTPRTSATCPNTFFHVQAAMHNNSEVEEENPLGFAVQFLESIKQEICDLTSARILGNNVNHVNPFVPDNREIMESISDIMSTTIPHPLSSSSSSSTSHSPVNSMFYGQNVNNQSIRNDDNIIYNSISSHNDGGMEDYCAELLNNSLELCGTIIKFKAGIDIHGIGVAHIFFSSRLDAIFYVSPYCMYQALKEFREGNLDKIIPILKSEVSMPPVEFNMSQDPYSQVPLRQLNLLNELFSSFLIPRPVYGAPIQGHVIPGVSSKPTKKIHNAEEAIKELENCTIEIQRLAIKYNHCYECAWYSWAFYEKKTEHIIAIENDEDFEIVKGYFVKHMNKAHPDICARKMKLQDAAKYT